MNHRVLTQFELESRWVAAEGIPGVIYRFSDLVRIKFGECSGKTGEVIALLSTDPEPVYMVVVSPDERSVVLSQRELESTGSTAGRTLKLNN